MRWQTMSDRRMMRYLFLNVIVIFPFACLALIGDAQAQYKGDHDKALADSSEVIRLRPNNDEAYVRRSAIWLARHEYDKALSDCERALAINSNNALAHYYCGSVRHHNGEYEKAVAEYNRSLAINPKFADAYNDLAAIQANCPDARYRDGPKAFQNAKQAYLLSNGKSFIYTCTLAEAYAENGDFQHARQWMEKAIAMAAVAGHVRQQDTKEMRASLELFKQGKAYREELGSW
jgi:tetratricopeptide (TPR) repeat protein